MSQRPPPRLVGSCEQAELVRLTLAVVAINGWNRFNIAFHVPAGNYKAGSLKGWQASHARAS